MCRRHCRRRRRQALIPLCACSPTHVRAARSGADQPLGACMQSVCFLHAGWLRPPGVRDGQEEEHAQQWRGAWAGRGQDRPGVAAGAAGASQAPHCSRCGLPCQGQPAAGPSGGGSLGCRRRCARLPTPPALPAPPCPALPAVLLKNAVDACVATVCWWALGNAFANGKCGQNAFIGESAGVGGWG